MKLLALALGLSFGAATAGAAGGAERLRVIAQKTGTFGWELDIVRRHRLAQTAGIELDIVEMASPEAGKIALKAGSADIIVADLMWVARDRALGGSLTFHPYTTALGAVMVPASSPVRTATDLAGLRLGVAGGALDKSWLMLQALTRRSGLDLRRKATIQYGAPQLLNAKAGQGELDAVLNYWNLSAALEIQGFRRAIEMTEVQRQLGARAPVSIVGYAFDSRYASSHADTIGRFLAVADEAKDRLASDREEWTLMADRIGTRDERVLDIYRRRYAQGVPRRSVAEEEEDARILYRIVAEIGGPDLLGPATELPAGTYWAFGPTR